LRLDLEALRALDVFKIDAAESRLQRCDGLDHALDVSAAISISNTSMPANFLKRTALPSMTGFDASGRYCRAQHGGTVGNHGNEIGAGRQRGRLGGIGGNRGAGGRNPGE